MTDNINNLILEHLRALRTDIAEIKADLRDVKDGQISAREEIQSLRRDGLRQERTMAAMQLDIDRVKTRLDLRDA